jgi:PQQ-dependent dehydrogenase (methanol/ethanol family)
MPSTRKNISRLFLIGMCLIQTVGFVQPVFSQATQSYVPVTDAMLQNPDPADWLMWRRTLNTWGYSPLDQINTDNVEDIRMAWTRTLGPGIQEGTPIVYDGKLIFPGPSDYVQAFDAVSGTLLWEYRRQLPADLSDYLPFSAINRNMALYGDLLIDTSPDDFIYALNIHSGEMVWETKILDYQRGAQQTSGPIIANGKAISGRGCEPEGGPDACVILAHDALTGEELWRTHTIATEDDPNNVSWGDVPWENRRHVGSWMVPSFDPELNLLYIGTSVTSPAPKYILAGNDLDYLYHNSTLALDADTGEIVWHYQHGVDHWDHDQPFERLLVDTVVAPDPEEVQWINPDLVPGEVRKVMTGIPGKTGLVYTLDRETGEFLWADSTVFQNVISSIDGASGQVTVNPESLFTEVDQERIICPHLNGGKNFPTGAYSPLNNVMYFPLHNTCALTVSTATEQSLDDLYGMFMRIQTVPGQENIGSLFAIDVATGKTLWKYDDRAIMMSLLTTGSGLIFGGDSNGYFKAFDQENGELLWQINIGSPVSGYPVTYAIDGKQYVAVSTGFSIVAATAGSLAPEQRPGNGNNLFIFTLPD